jgi:hypothetical protein
MILKEELYQKDKEDRTVPGSFSKDGFESWVQ